MASELLYRSTQMHGLLWSALPAIGLGIAALLLWLGRPHAGVAAAAVVACCAAALLCLGRLVIEVRADSLQWQFGYLGWPSWQVDLGRIRQAQPAASAAIQGAGVRDSAMHRRYTTDAGGSAVKLTLDDDSTVTLGTPDPDALARLINQHLPARR